MKNFNELLAIIRKHLSLDEIVDLSYQLGMDPDNYMSGAKPEKSRDLILQAYQRNVLDSLVDLLRPKLSFVILPSVSSIRAEIEGMRSDSFEDNSVEQSASNKYKSDKYKRLILVFDGVVKTHRDVADMFAFIRTRQAHLEISFEKSALNRRELEDNIRLVKIFVDEELFNLLDKYLELLFRAGRTYGHAERKSREGQTFGWARTKNQVELLAQISDLKNEIESEITKIIR